jgi:DNA polymerase-1
MSDAKKKLVLIDGHALAYRAYHALPVSLATSQGELTNAVYGFTSMLLNVLRDEQPDYIAVAFDVGRTFRHDAYPDYKGTRLKMPGELSTQIDRIREVIRAFNIPIFEVEGYEADDVLGTLARQAAGQGVATLIVTGDTDTFQLINPDVKVMASRRQFSDTVVYDEQGIRERYDLAPEQLTDFKALKGDVSDNIPGVPGIGDKTATELLHKYGSVEAVVAHAGEVSNKRVRQALEQYGQQALLGKKLTTIVTDVPIQLDLEACRATDYAPEQVTRIFRELEFKSLFDRLPAARPRQVTQLSMFEAQAPLTSPPVPLSQGEREGAHYQVVDTPVGLDRLVQQLAAAPAVVVDVETTDTDALKAALVGIALTTQVGEGIYLPVGHKPESGVSLPLDLVREKLGPILADPAIPKIAHNAKYDLTVLLLHGFDVRGDLFDTMVAGWLAEPERRGFGLKDLAWHKLGVEMQEITALIGKGKDQISMDRVAVARAAAYAGADVDMTLRLQQVYQKELAEKGLMKLFTEVEMPLVPILTEMEMTGIRLDVSYLAQLSRELYQRITELESQIYAAAGYPFNINSTQQLASILFDQLKLTPLKRTKTGYSTDASVLEELKGQHPIVDLLLEYRQLTKLKSTYVDALPLLVNLRTGRVHTSYNQTGAVTGRLTSSDPNLQNIPIRSDEGRRIRRAFIAEPGHVLLAADYSQVELRIMAHISGDAGLLAAFRRGEDIHAATAATIFGVALNEVTPLMRRVAKSINFGLSYGMSSYGLAQRTDLSQEDADRFVQNYFANYPGVKVYMDRTRQQAAKQGYVETLLGRRRYFPQFQSSRQVHASERARAEREAINHPIQGSAADIMKIAMIRLHRALEAQRLGARILLQVHDELVLEVPEAEVEATVPVVRAAMEGAFELAAPLKVDVKVGPNWEEMNYAPN